MDRAAAFASDVRHQEAHDRAFVSCQCTGAFMTVGAEHRETPSLAQNDGLHHLRDAFGLRQFGVNCLRTLPRLFDDRRKNEWLAVRASHSAKS